MKRQKQRDYVPIDCGFYDRIEVAIMRGNSVQFAYVDHMGEAQMIQTRLLDTVQRADGEFVKLPDDLLIRMDRIIRINEHEMPDNNCSL